VVAVVHDLALVRSSFTHAVLLRNHLIAAGSPERVLGDAPLQAAFGPGLTAAAGRI
jgi:ABC-type Mn2+/Zn2+ transport system ATPase subunit